MQRFNPQPRTSSAAAVSGAEFESVPPRRFQPTAENVLGCCDRAPMSPLGQMSCFNPQPRTSSAAARPPPSGCTRSPSFNPQPRTSSAAAERAKTCMTRMEFQPTAENVLGCCPGSRVRACPDWDRFNPQPRTSSAAARPRGSCRPDLRVSTHSRERPRLLPVARRATTSGSTFQPTAENVLGCCPACQPSARSRSRCFNPQPRTSSAAARRHPRQIDAPHHVSTHSRERPRLLPPGNSQGPRCHTFQPTAENVLGCCHRLRATPAGVTRFNPQPRTSSAAAWRCRWA